MQEAALYLIPVTLGETTIDKVLPAYNQRVIGGISHFIVENVRTARRFLKKSNPDIEIDSLTFYTLNQHTRLEEIAEYLNPLAKGFSIGIISEAGCPAIADPGADIVAIAQNAGYKVVPLVGPSSILMSLMASGFNGQNFAFHGYLPIEGGERNRAIKTFEQRIYSESQTQIFIETPYRNHKLLEDLIRTCRPQTRLCIAADITCENEYIRTRTLKQWSREKIDLQKRPCIFLLYK
ncbi:SAM-dependent methyltransferase [Coprobacter tertius]|uniref:SAM-dependent methyltransferase n=1 Tax=Coprobacter tertius TaxID=2944915 RepID=A0ABT1MJZ7_9BACT|nr:SAM-dependent methyltransferase [Coprobacter tertius]MCP9612964.1 SAM-dependent methyltransferase [Coprobacter tertius]